ncbi:hypothetical protein HFO58_34770 [Rhizobium leguminosarum]|uniref:winged helix-turn-helix domain-containing protein n=1 Tax=Rhizobium leguminosarum TaxID=384 RepID=UPI001C984C1F|nr:winged helix-turn-helix domain-containing protein [Rhizobium leguminosarum]MBY5538239.1 hypothetical protein [Rhizobium leguminosarum]
MSDNVRSGIYRFGPYVVNAIGRTLLRDGVEVTLGSRAFDLLIALVNRQGDVLSHRELMAFAWSGLSVEDSNVRVQMAHLRRELGCGVAGVRYIMSVAGRGYCFVAPVVFEPSEGAAHAAHFQEFSNEPEGKLIAESRAASVLPLRIPRPLARLVGRDQNIADLKGAINERRFVTVVGPGGVGKTSLALKVAHEIESFETVHFVDLSTVLRAERVIDTVTAVSGLKVEPDEILLERFVEHVSKQRSLVVLDNCEHVVDAVAEIIEFVMQRATDTHLLVTSREAMRLPEEAVYILRPLGFPPNNGRLTAERARSWPSIELFMDRAARGGFQQRLDDENAAIVASICRRLDGNPLAIELTASRVGSYGLEKVASLVDNQLALRWKGKRNASPRHQTVEAMLDWSFDLLAQASRDVLQRLSVFVGDFSLEAAIAVAKGDDISTSDTTDAIGELVEKSLLSAFSSEGPARMRLLETTKTYAKIKLAESGSEAYVRRRHALYYLETLSRYSGDVLQASGSAAGLGLQFDLDNVLAALEWAFSDEGDVLVAVELSSLSVPIFFKHWRMLECAKWCKRALAAIPADMMGSAVELRLLESFATASFYTSHNVSETEAAFQRGLELSRVLDDSRTEFHLLAGMHFLALKSGDYRKMLDLSKRYAIEATLRGSQVERTVAQWLLGSSYHMMGDQRLAKKSYDAGLELSGSLGVVPLLQFENAQRAVANVLHARMVWLQGSHSLSIHLAEEAIREARGEIGPLCVTLVVGVEILMLCGKFDQARIFVQKLNMLTRRYSLAGLHEAGLTMRDQLRLFQGQAERAVDLMRSHLDAIRNGRLVASTLTALGAIAQGLIQSGSHDDALAAIDAALAIDERAGGSFRLPELLRIKARAMMESPDPRLDAANSILLVALETAREHGSLSWELRISADFVRLRQMAGDDSDGEALRSLMELLTRFNGENDMADIISVHDLLASLGVIWHDGAAKPTDIIVTAEYAARHLVSSQPDDDQEVADFEEPAYRGVGWG